MQTHIAPATISSYIAYARPWLVDESSAIFRQHCYDAEIYIPSAPGWLAGWRRASARVAVKSAPARHRSRDAHAYAS